MRVIWIMPCALLVTAGATWWLLGLRLTAASIMVDGLQVLGRGEVLSYLEADQGILPRQAMTNAIARKLIAHPWIEDVRLRWRYFPLHLTVEVVEEEPWFIADFGFEAWLVGRSGAILQPTSQVKDTELIIRLPQVDGWTFPSIAAEGGLVDEFQRIVASLRIYELAGGFPFKVSQFRILPHAGLRLIPEDVQQPDVFIPCVSSFPESLQVVRRLRQVLADLHVRGERVAQIDLRFARQTVVELQGQENNFP